MIRKELKRKNYNIFFKYILLHLINLFLSEIFRYLNTSSNTLNGIICTYIQFGTLYYD